MRSFWPPVRKSKRSSALAEAAPERVQAAPILLRRSRPRLRAERLCELPLGCRLRAARDRVGGLLVERLRDRGRAAPLGDALDDDRPAELADRDLEHVV